MSYVVTLVHGTWARRSEWTLEGSHLRTTLENRLGSIEFRRVQWSGGNWARDRLEAAEQLREHLKETLSQRPDARHFIIAHSHGGNAVMYALQDAQLRRRVAGVVTLATPFLNVGVSQIGQEPSREALKLLVAFFGGLAALVAFATLFLGAGFIFVRMKTPGMAHDILIMIVEFGLLLAFAALLYAPRAIGRVAGERLLERFTRLREDLALAASYTDLPVLIIRTTGDEASGVLAASQLLSWLIGRAATAIAWLADMARLIVKGGLLPPIFRRGKVFRGDRVGFSILIVAAWALNFAWASKYEPIVKADFAFPVWTLCLSFFFGFLSLGLVSWVLRAFFHAAIAVLLLLRASALSLFGVDVAMASVVLDVTAEPTPPGSWRVLNVCAKGLGGLAHSHIYNDEDTLTAIADFLRNEG